MKTIKLKNKINKTRKKYNKIQKGGGDYEGLRQLIETNEPDNKIMTKIKRLFYNNELTTNMVFYELTKFHASYENVYAKLMQQIPFSCRSGKFCDKICGENPHPPTYMEIFRMIQKIGNLPIMIYGGAVRDFIQTNYDILTMNDIDINYNTNYYNITDFLSKNTRKREHCFKHYTNESKKYILFGDKYEDEEGKYLEGFQIVRNTTFDSYSFLESRCNSLSIVVDFDKTGGVNFYLIDFFNDSGINDAKRKIFCASFIDADLTEENLLEWVSHSKKTKALWRIFRFMLRGYTVEPNTAIAIYKYWWANRKNNDLPNKIEWDKIWDVLPIKYTEDVFGREGLLHRELSIYSDVPDVPSYEEMLEHLEQLGYIIRNADGRVEGNIPTKQMLSRLEKKEAFESFQKGISITHAAVTLQSFYRSRSVLRKMKKSKSKSKSPPPLPPPTDI